MLLPVSICCEVNRSFSSFGNPDFAENRAFPVRLAGERPGGRDDLPHGCVKWIGFSVYWTQCNQGMFMFCVKKTFLKFLDVFSLKNKNILLF